MIITIFDLLHYPLLLVSLAGLIVGGVIIIDFMEGGNNES